MEALSARHLIAAVHGSSPGRYPLIPCQRRKFLHLGSTISAKQSQYRDYQRLAKPSRLLKAEEVKICTEYSPENASTSLRANGSRSLYKIKFQTSSAYGSGLSDAKAGILVCFIDENDDSILQRISASLMHSADINAVQFQRGSVNEYIFDGPKLGKIRALWVGLEFGHWRLGSLSLITVSRTQPPPVQRVGENFHCHCICYEFDADDTLLGDGSDNSMAELTPRLLYEFSEADPTFLSKSAASPDLRCTHGISSEESMSEYANLKFSLLLYDLLLILSGTSILLFSTGENSAFAFLTGGIGGLLYLLLLQKSVDELPAPGSNFSNGMFRGLQSRVSGFALALGFIILAAKYTSGAAPAALTPKGLVVGIMGFLTCKVAVVLAAFKPFPRHFEENN